MESLMVFFTLLVIGVLLLIFSTTRLIGVVGLTLLFLVFPFAFLLLFFLGGLFLYCNFKFKRMKYYEQPKLFD